MFGQCPMDNGHVPYNDLNTVNFESKNQSYKYKTRNKLERSMSNTF